ncbi:hypothetical protein BABINDRAFT_165261 [Babjeviella inositovora NRRL Y-12698]|uniref:Survival protein SurE-like phosphatase/nucleotidase domain-containing protein n=1 Tax=Babjeviella inositovora NRRL Y-12698 TaxID=984486 RepID=A0A1E3QXH6_9ASCO|nr:uncharacterized protein BABINDRAFT_165261 [Babjeviella inositovora NRRL Y-12698]ODQ81737.1 hypothetical protein BABINDRAFT_165261 [Babjeviella inositovora NRRL Y-12698]
MHVLLTNDDGPLCDAHSPYIAPLAAAIKAHTTWELSIATPSAPRSWIGKAHFADQTITAAYLYPTEGNSYDGPFAEPQPELLAQGRTEWVTVDSTPAAASDMGIHHLFQHKAPIDLVISGPNFGENVSSVFMLASGTVGASMEAALHGMKSVSLSFKHEPEHMLKPEIITEACHIGVKLIEHLYRQWPQDRSVDLYTINVPMVPSLKLGETKIEYTSVFQNTWGSLFVKDPLAQQWQWQPDFAHVVRQIAADKAQGVHNDAVCIHDGKVSVTALKASYKDVPLSGEIVLGGLNEGVSRLTVLDRVSATVALTIPKDAYIYEALLAAVNKHLNAVVVDTLPATIASKVFHFGDYEELNTDEAFNPNYLLCSYIYRKALIRKHYLAHTIHSYVVKHPQSCLTKNFPTTYQLEVDYAEFLDESLDDCYELREEIMEGEKTWILKPSMSDRGQGIRIFQTVEQLQAIFDSFEEESSDEEEEEEEEETTEHKPYGGDNGVITSQLRHFVVQEYQANPLLLPAYNNKKFHLRCYVVASGALKVYVYKPMLTLFALSQFKLPQANDNDEIELYGHLTNTCLQGEENAILNNSVVEFWHLEGISDTQKQQVFALLCDTVSELFNAAVSVDKMNFQPMANAFEIFGVDFLVDDAFGVTLLEVNSYPDFKQTGDDLKGLIYGLFDDVVSEVVAPFFHGKQGTSHNLVSVLDQSTSGAW